MSDHTSPPPAPGGEPEYDRRRGPRRRAVEGEVPAERRQTDRRQRVPGVAGLLQAIETVDEPAAAED